MTYKDDRKFADSYLIEQINVLKTIYKKTVLKFKISNFFQDTQQGIDLQLLIDNKIVNIALRIRKEKYLKYQDITFRAYRKNSKTEIDKLKEQIGNYILYTYLKENKIAQYVYIEITKELINLLKNKDIIYNKDNTTGFVTLTFEEIKNLNGIIKKNR